MAKIELLSAYKHRRQNSHLPFFLQMLHIENLPLFISLTTRYGSRIAIKSVTNKFEKHSVKPLTIFLLNHKLLDYSSTM